jgi:CcmD family protein
MTNLTRVILSALFMLSVHTTSPAAPAPNTDGAVMRVAQAPPSQQGEFVPIDQLPPQEQLAAAPLLIGAYAFVLVMLFGYVVSLSRRLTTIQREVDRLDADLKRGSRA